MTNRIDRLEKRGLVAREPDPDERRGVRLHLTAKGFELIERTVTTHVENEQRLLAGLSEGERLHLAKLLGKLMSSIQR